MNPEITESFSLPRTGQPEDTAPVRASLWVPAASAAFGAPAARPEKPVRQINWSRVIAFATVLVVSVAVWIAVAIAVERVWK